MLTVLIDTQTERLLGPDFATSLRELGVGVDYSDGSAAATKVGIDAVVADEEHLGVVCEVYDRGMQRPSIVVVVPDPRSSTTRRLLRAGADSVLDVAATNAAEQALVVSATAAGFGVLPAGHGLQLAQRLEAPPRQLGDFELQLLSLASSKTIEAAGRQMGLSRRQAQRRFKTLCDDLGLKDHLAAAVAAALWGLTHGASASHYDAFGPPDGVERPPVSGQE